MLFKNKTDYSKVTKYCREMTTKMNNYTLLNKKYSLKNQTVLLGDSITDFFNYYELFYDFCKSSGQAVYNRGISGDTTDRLLERLYDNVLSIEPKNIVLLIGTNDIGRGLPLSMSVSNMEKIMVETKKTCPDVNFIVEAVYPVNENMRDRFEKRSNKKINEMNNEFIKLCEKHDCVWLDFTDKLKDEDGNLKKELTFDGLHINAEAYEIIAENVIPLLK
ncbi:MAG: GDSL family lipase [Clostridia bacterium]|nr:GDSL family lipase [Clostridia bacterium]